MLVLLTARLRIWPFQITRLRVGTGSFALFAPFTFLRGSARVLFLALPLLRVGRFVAAGGIGRLPLATVVTLVGPGLAAVALLRALVA